MRYITLDGKFFIYECSGGETLCFENWCFDKEFTCSNCIINEYRRSKNRISAYREYTQFGLIASGTFVFLHDEEEM